MCQWEEDHQNQVKEELETQQVGSSAFLKRLLCSYLKQTACELHAARKLFFFMAYDRTIFVTNFPKTR